MLKGGKLVVISGKQISDHRVLHTGKLYFEISKYIYRIFQTPRGPNRPHII